MASSPIQKIKHLAFIDGLRALAAFYIVLHHSFQYGGAKHPESLLSYLAFPFKYGHYVVGLFIVLSGFCLMLPFVNSSFTSREQLMRFYGKRVRRILPPYYIAIVVSLVLSYTIIGDRENDLWDSSLDVTSFDVIAHLLLFHDIFYIVSHKINYVLWSISVEFRIYLLFPLLVYGIRKFGWQKTIATSVLVSCLLWKLLVTSNLNTSLWGINPQFLALFTFGTIACYLAFSEANAACGLRKISTIHANSSIFFVSLFLCCLLWLPVFEDSQNLSSLLKDLILGLNISYILFLISTGRLPFVNKFLSFRILSNFGVYSYSIYLMHPPILRILWQFGIRPLGSSQISSVMLLACTAPVFVAGLCYLFFLLAERPFTNHSNSKGEKRSKKNKVQPTISMIKEEI